MTQWIQTTVQGMLSPQTADQSIQIIEAAFSRLGDVLSAWKQTTESPKDEMIMESYDIKKPILVQDNQLSELGRPFGVCVVMIPIGNAQLTLNGKKATAQVLPMDLDGHLFITNALTFPEN